MLRRAARRPLKICRTAAPIKLIICRQHASACSPEPAALAQGAQWWSEQASKIDRPPAKEMMTRLDLNFAAGVDVKMKGVSMSMATFIFLLVQTDQDTESFMIILFVFVLMGSGMLLLTNQDDEERGISDIGHAIWKMVLLTLGDYDDSSYDSAFKGVVFLVFIFLMVS